ncbi:MAG: polysaccharide biosynthesis protein [Armatimonadetes bacterium]|nr:polysaccharide biosynthesis protein [Armatimonadota bacterium]
MQGWKRLSKARWAALLGIVVADLFLVNIALAVSVGISHDVRFLDAVVGYALRVALPVNVVTVLLFWWRRLHRINARFLGIVDLLNISGVGLALGVTLAVTMSFSAPTDSLTRQWTAPLLFALFSATLLAMCRVYQRMVAFRAVALNRPMRRSSRRILVVGAGDLGEALLGEIAKSEFGDAHVVGFIDDDPRLHGTTIHGVPVLGGVESVHKHSEKLGVTEILIAMPKASEDEMRRVFNACILTEARVSALPPLSRFVDGSHGLLNHMREISADELLKRSCEVDGMKQSARYLNGERVLITGGGGSIGSELARQVSLFSPASMILVGKGENSIFEIDQEMRHANLFQPNPVICDIRDRQGLGKVFREHKPTVVFHAAAHKHVPLMEAVPIEAVRNNVFGTLNVAEEALRAGVERFILVSTDKAVNPSNVMGATKRVAEMIVSAMSKRSDTSFSAVRFGNVLGSRGSLIPTLKKQILSGGPITLTHPEMTRFFMTIPESVQLIVQAGAMGNKGEVFILDMGDPVSIVDLAKGMIRLHGLVPGQDIEIKYTGIRPGEKIHEELSMDIEDLLPSGHKRIRMVRSQQTIEWEWLKAKLDELQRLCDAGDESEVRAFLMELAWGKTMPPMTGSAVVWEGDVAEQAAQESSN